MTAVDGAHDIDLFLLSFAFGQGHGKVKAFGAIYSCGIRPRGAVDTLKGSMVKAPRLD